MKGILKGVISVFLVVGLMITIGSCKAPSGVAETEVATTSGVTETTEAKKEPEIGEVKVIRFVTPETDPAVVELFRKQISEYEELHPDVKVQLELVPLANLGSYYGPNIAGGNVPEVGGCIGGLLVEYLGMDILEPLDDVIAEMGGEEAFYKGSLIKGSDGKIYNLPYCGGGPVFWVREDLFEQYGVKIPTNWNEWLEAAKALTL
ncbi:MAG: extracellular solute-binding protein, partial [Actinobacteria bacterium]|nr:extracellular solute-binding protein [Actinomycetota bacterium]